MIARQVQRTLGWRHVGAHHPPKMLDTTRMIRSPRGCSYGRRSRFEAASSRRTCTQSTSSKTMTIALIRMNTEFYACLTPKFSCKRVK
jgi:hypothetical protein